MRYLPRIFLFLAFENDAFTSAEVTVPVDTITVSFVDTIVVRVADTVLRIDTVVVHDTTLVRDSVFTHSEPDSLIFPLEGYIGDATMETLDLGTYQIPELSRVWVRIELSANSQKDEAWGLRQVLSGQARDVPLQSCPLVPDYPWLGEGWVFVGFAKAGEFSLEARHAFLYDCYDPVDGFRSANSVHFKAIKFVF